MQAYNPITHDAEAVNLFRSTFQAPLPMSGSSCSKLGDLPTQSDHIYAKGSNRELTITAWNTQTHHIPTAIAYRAVEHQAPQAAAPANRRPPPAVLIDGCLNQVVALLQINNTQRRQLLQGKGRFIDMHGNILTTLPQRPVYRSAAMSAQDAAEIATAYNTATPRQDARARAVRENTPIQQCHPEGFYDVIVSDDEAEELPAKRAHSRVVPVRTVRTVSMAIKGYTPTVPPKAPAMIQIEQQATNNERATTRPYESTARSVLARDIPAMQELVSYAASYNASYMDTAAALRGLLYVYPHSPDAWYHDSYDRRFLRGQDLSTRGHRINRILPVDAAQRLHIRVIAVTLPAFSSHLKNLDPGMRDDGPDGIPLSRMDSDWLAVPISSDMIGEPWLLEYILCFTTTSIWAGRMSVLSQAHHGVGGAVNNVYSTGMPNAHQVHIPGPKNIVLVLIDENTYAQQTTLNLPGGVQPLDVYRGTRIAAGVDDFHHFWVDIGPQLYALFTDATYPQSAQNMVKCLQYIENNLCRSMAFQLALTLAAEIASAVPEAPALLGDELARYEDELAGAWTIGVVNLNIRRPHHTTSNIDEGNIETINNRMRRLLHGHAFAQVSPMQRHAISYSNLQTEEVLVNGVHMGTATHWAQDRPQHTVEQYQCYTSNSVYRILAGAEFLIKDDFVYSFKNTDGVQNVTTMQGVALSLSLGIALCKSDVTRKAWSGLGVNEAPVSQTPIRNWVSLLSQGMILSSNTDAHMVNIINGQFTILQEIDSYYGFGPNSATWGMSVCLPYSSFLQWAAKFKIDMKGSAESSEGVITAELESPHLIVEHTGSAAVSWFGTTLDTFAYLPATFMDYQRGIPYMVSLSVEDWQQVTATQSETALVPAGYMSNLSLAGLKNHYRHVAKPGQALIINKYAMRMRDSMWNVNDMQYPDPPNSDFLAPQEPTLSKDPSAPATLTPLLPATQITETTPHTEVEGLGPAHP